MPDLLETRCGDVVILTLNRPDRMNAFSDEMLRGLIEAFPRLGADPSVGSIVVTGAGRGFCAGGDVKSMTTRADLTFEERVENLRWKQQIPLLIRRCPKVVIAMLNGVAVGAGLGIAMSCDLRIASSTARFGTAFAKIGFAGDFGGTWTLTQLVGTARARQLYLSADMFDSAQALDWGIVSQVVEQEDLESTVMAEANRFANGPRVAYAYMKLNLNAAETESFSSVLDLEVVHQIRTSMTEDHQEASRAFVDKRLPIFKGR